MKAKQLCFVLAVVALLATIAAPASAETPLGSAITYQGMIKKDGSPVHCVEPECAGCDFEFSLWDHATSTNPANQVGTTQAMPDVPVIHGLFMVTLNEGGEFGSDPFNGNERWLQITVQCPSDSGPITLDDRQEVTPAPYALYALDGPGVGGGDGHSLDAADGTPEDAVYVNGIGDVGIGTPDPEAALHVRGAYRIIMECAGCFGYAPTFEGRRLNNMPAYPTRVVADDGLARFGGGGYDGSGFSGLEAYISMNAAETWEPGKHGSDIRFVTTANGGINSQERMRITDDGKVRINAEGGQTSSLQLYEAGEYGFEFQYDGAPDNLYLWSRKFSDNEAIRMTWAKNGNVGIGTTDPSDALHLSSDATTRTAIHLENTLVDQHYIVQVTGSGAPGREGNLEIWREDPWGIGLVMQPDGDVGIGTLTPGAKLDVAGRIKTEVLEITGADLAERFPVTEQVRPGMVMEIDPEHPGQLRIAQGAYNRRVAGVVSGAKDLPTGAILGNLPGNEDAPPIALSGRVYVWADVSNGSIQPGDLLTTSDTPGHAMKVTDHQRGHGAILGKAMTELEYGRGLVLALVALQ